MKRMFHLLTHDKAMVCARPNRLCTCCLDFSLVKFALFQVIFFCNLSKTKISKLYSGKMQFTYRMYNFYIVLLHLCVSAFHFVLFFLFFSLFIINNNNNNISYSAWWACGLSGSLPLYYIILYSFAILYIFWGNKDACLLASILA